MSKVLGTIGFRKRGTWMPNTPYRKDDMTEHDRSSLYALVDHVSSETFEEDADKWGYIADARGVTASIEEANKATENAQAATEVSIKATEASNAATEQALAAAEDASNEAEDAREVTEVFKGRFKIIENAEFLYGITDAEGFLLFGIRHDGSVYQPKGIPDEVRHALEKEIKDRTSIADIEESGNYIATLVDKDNRVIAGVDEDGNFHFSKNIRMNGAMQSVIENKTESLYHIVDKNGVLLFGIDSRGHIIMQKGATLDGNRSKIDFVESERFLFGLTDSNGNLLAGIDKSGAILANKITGVGTCEVVESDEFTFMFVDKGEHLLFGVRKDGSFYSPKFELPFSKSIEDMEFIYVILDADGRVCWGIRNDGTVYQPKGTPERTKRDLKNIYSLINNLTATVSGIQQVKGNNIATEKVMYDGNQGRAYLGNVALQEPGKTDYCIIMMYGQSLSNGSENPAGFYDQPTENCFMLGSNVWNTTGTALQALSCGGTKRDDGVCTGTRQDTIISTVNAFVNMYKKERPWDKNTKFIACSLGVGGRTVAQLSGAARYPYCNEHQLDARVKPFFQAVKAIADSEGKTISLSAVFWKQGESDYGTGYIGKTYDEWKEAATAQAQSSPTSMSMSGSKDAYYKGLTLLKEDIFALAKEIFGEDQQNRPVFMPYSVCGTYINNAYMTINEATAQMAEDQDDVVQVGPTYVTPDYNGGHLAMNGYRWFGEYCAKALYNVYLKGIDWHPLQPYNYEVQGNKIYIYMNTPVPPLRFDKYTLDNAYKTNGFTVRMGTVEQLDAAKTITSNSSLIQTITDIAIVENCVVLTCGNIEQFTGAVEVTYAGQGQSGYSGHNQGAGNLRDSDTWQALNEYRNDAGDHGNRTTFSNWSAAVATDDDKSTLEAWSAEKTYAYGDKCLYEHSNGTTYRLTSNKDNNTGTPYSSGTTLRTSNRWNGSTKATSEELEELEYLDENYLSNTGYSYGDKVLFDVIEQDGPIVLTSNYGGASGGVNKTRPFNPVNYRPVDVKGELIAGKKYPMQNWCLNFYKRIILG